MFQYILFDLDGTLTDPKEGICKSVQYALHKMGIEETDLDRLEPFIGPPLIDSFMDFYHLSREDAEKAVVFYRERFSALGLYENKVYPGIPELLGRCKEQGSKLAVASSKPEVYVRKILKHFNMLSFFDVIVGSELDGRRTKKEEVVEEALAQLKQLGGEPLTKANTAMVGDRKFDIEGAREFGLTGIGVEFGYAARGELKKAGADQLAGTVRQLENILLRQTAVEKPLPEKSFFRAVYILTPFALYFLVFELAEILAVVFLQGISGSKDISQISLGALSSEQLTSVIGMMAMLLGGLVLFFVYRRTDRMPQRAGWNPALSFGLGLTLALGLNLLFGYLCELLPVSDASYEAASFNDSVTYVMGLLVYVVVSPPVEEVVFRWLTQGRIRRVLGAKIAIVASALFFGFYHGNLLQGMYAFLMGLVLALVYEWSGSFLQPVILHMAANFIIFTLSYLPEKFAGIIESLPGCILSLILAGVLLWAAGKKNHEN